MVEFMSVNDGDLSNAGCQALQEFGGYCGCMDPPPPDNGCTFCPDGSPPSNPDKVVSELFTCQQLHDFVLFAPLRYCDGTEAEDGMMESADLVLMRAFAYNCGCPGVEPACTLCPNGNSIPQERHNQLSGDGVTSGVCRDCILFDAGRMCFTARSHCLGGGAVWLQ